MESCPCPSLSWHPDAFRKDESAQRALLDMVSNAIAVPSEDARIKGLCHAWLIKSIYFRLYTSPPPPLFLSLCVRAPGLFHQPSDF